MREYINNSIADQDVFEKLYEEWFERLQLFGYSYIRNREVAKELVQDVFLKLFEIRHTLTEEMSVVSYMYAMMKNRCLDYIKHQKIELQHNQFRQQEYIYLLANQYALEDSSINIIVENEIRQALMAAIDRLPAKSREVFVRSRFEGKKNREIAIDLGISEKTVEFHISKSITVLRKELAHLYIYVMAFVELFNSN